MISFLIWFTLIQVILENFSKFRNSPFAVLAEYFKLISSWLKVVKADSETFKAIQSLFQPLRSSYLDNIVETCRSLDLKYWNANCHVINLTLTLYTTKKTMEIAVCLPQFAFRACARSLPAERCQVPVKDQGREMIITIIIIISIIKMITTAAVNITSGEISSDLYRTKKWSQTQFLGK